MLRYIRLYLHCLRFSLSKALEFRLNFWTRMAMDTVYYLTGLAFFKLLYLHTPTLGDWSEEQAMIFISACFVVDALQMTIIAENMWQIPVLVNSGQLDYFLIRPVSSLFFLSFRDFSVSSMVNLCMAVSLLVWFILQSSASFSPANVALFALFLGGGFFFWYALRLLFIIPVFWLHSGRGLESLFWRVEPLFERPDSVFRGAARLVLTTVLPFLLIASFPTRVLFEGPRAEIVFWMLGILALTALFLRFIWAKALAAYSSASS